MLSDSVRKGVDAAPRRSLFNALGFTEEEMNKLFVNSIREMYKVKTTEGKRCIAVMINNVENSIPFNKDL